MPKYARATAREAKIWKPFGYSFPFTNGQIADRITIMGLYACSYLNNHKYLQEVESEDLAYLLNDYNSKMAELTTQQQIVVADIVGKRYLASVDKLIHDQQMITKHQGIDYDNALMDAKIAALAADRAALTTMAEKIATETQKTQARIAELQAYIQIEGANLSHVEIEIAQKEIDSGKVDIAIANAENDILRIQTSAVKAAADLVKMDVEIAQKEIDSGKVDIAIANAENDILRIQTSAVKAAADLVKMDVEIAQKELESAKLDIEKLQVANEILRIQVETVEAAMQLIDIDVRIASTKVDIAQTQRNIAKMGLLADDLLIEQAKTTIEQAGIPISEARILLAQAKYDDATAEETYMRELLTKEAENYTNRLNLKEAQFTSKAQSLEHRQQLQDAENLLKVDLSNLNLLLTADDAASQTAVDNIKVGEISQKVSLAWSKVYAAIAAAEKSAAAEITTSLTHTVQKV